MCCGNNPIRVDQPSVPVQQGFVAPPVQATVAQVNAVKMDDSINSQRAEAIQANFHAQKLGNNG